MYSAGKEALQKQNQQGSTPPNQPLLDVVSLKKELEANLVTKTRARDERRKQLDEIVKMMAAIQKAELETLELEQEVLTLVKKSLEK
jgi:hypothetical protein